MWGEGGGLRAARTIRWDSRGPRPDPGHRLAGSGCGRQRGLWHPFRLGYPRARWPRFVHGTALTSRSTFWTSRTLCVCQFCFVSDSPRRPGAPPGPRPPHLTRAPGLTRQTPLCIRGGLRVGAGNFMLSVGSLPVLSERPSIKGVGGWTLLITVGAPTQETRLAGDRSTLMVPGWPLAPSAHFCSSELFFQPGAATF